MKTLRISVQVITTVYVGEDIQEGQTVERSADVLDTTKITTDRPMGIFVPAHEHTGQLAALMLRNAAQTLGERVDHELKKKGL